MIFETKKFVDYNKLLEELQAILGDDMTEWYLSGEDVKDQDGSIIHKVRVTIINPSIKTTGIKKVLDSHTAEKVIQPAVATTKRKAKRS